MGKMATAKAALELKQKMLTKTEATIKTMETEFKQVATQQQKAEAAAKSEKDVTKKRKLETESSDLRKKGEELLKKKEAVAKTLPAVEKSVEDITKQIDAMETALEVFEKSRKDFLVWWKSYWPKIQAFLDALEKQQNIAEKADKDAETAVKAGNTVLAQTHATAAQTALTEATVLSGKVTQAVEAARAGQFTVQRNLKPGAGLEMDDIKQFNPLVTQMYKCYEEADHALTAADDAVTETKTAAQHARLIAAAGGDSADVYKEILKSAKTALDAKVTEYNTLATGNIWFKCAIDGGERFRADILKFQGKPDLKTAALKQLEQGRGSVPKAFEKLGILVSQANALVTKERGRVPAEFQRSLKPQMDPLVTTLMQLIQTHKTNAAKHPASMQAIEEFARAIG